MLEGRPLRAAWVYDDDEHRAANAAGRNYWDLYIDEVLNRLGLTAEIMPPTALADPDSLARYSLLFVGAVDAARASGAVGVWVAGGGTLVGFATRGLDECFGVADAGRVEQVVGRDGLPAEYAISAYFRLQATALTAAPLISEERGLPLLALAPARKVRALDAEALAWLMTPDGDCPEDGRRAQETGCPAITWRRSGKGNAFYFAFGLPQTMWLLHQGRPIDADHDGDGYLRAMDARLIAANDSTVPYSDDLHVLLQAMAGLSSMPLIHECPALGEDIPDAVFYFGGDDEGQPGNQVVASDFMASRGLPYHINCMADAHGQFAVSEEDIERIVANGHELSIHYDFVSRFCHPSGFTQEDVAAQMAEFVARFGHLPVCGVTHWVRWVGWSEPARWMLAVGQVGDNSWFGPTSPPLNPTNLMDFSFGSVLPRRRWEDWTGGNVALEFVQAPIGGYEVGYQGQEPTFDVLHDVADYALRYHVPVNLFYHPVYLATNAACRAAVDELTRYLRERGARPGFMGVDELVLWWLARPHARVGDIRISAEALRCEAECDWPAGFVLKACVGGRQVMGATVDGAAQGVRQSVQFGLNWVFVVVPVGQHQVVIDLR